MYIRSFAALLVIGLFATLGCGDSKPRRSRSSVKRTEVNAKSFLFNAEDFDLETIIALVKENKVEGAEGLEEVINSEDATLSNVDIDKDGTIDYVLVKEGRDGESITLDFKAVPSSTNEESDAETIASMSFVHNTTTKEVEVSGGYPSYANGYNDHYYSYRTPYRRGPSVGQMMFVAWLMTPSRPLYYRGYRSSYYVRRPVYSRSMMTSRRSSYRTTSRISPVRSTARPKSYSIKSASKKNSKFASGKSKVAKGTSFSSKKGSMKSFGKRDGNKTKRSASGFGAKKSSGGGFGSAKSKKSGSGFGGSKSKSSGSGFGRSSGRKSSFGSSSRSSGSRSSFGSSSRSGSSRSSSSRRSSSRRR